MNSRKVVTYEIGGFTIGLRCAAGVMPPSPYSLLLAHGVAKLGASGRVADVGTGTGLQAIVAVMCGAERAFINDVDERAVANALENARLNGVADRISVWPANLNAIETEVDVLISNPASLPMAATSADSTPYFAGPDGRSMIDSILAVAPKLLAPGGRVVLAHTTLANVAKTMTALAMSGFTIHTLSSLNLKFRPFYDREWIDVLGGRSAGLYSIVNGEPVETIFILEATRTIVTGVQATTPDLTWRASA